MTSRPNRDIKTPWVWVAQSPLASIVSLRETRHVVMVHGISQARILEWVAIFFFRGSSHKPVSPALAGGFFTAEPPGKHSEL